ncbi:Ig-like domain-containing protein [Peptostreptococcaceae bacterium AGR-M142]
MRKQLSVLLTTLIILMSVFNVAIGNSYAISTNNDLVNNLINNEGYSYLGKKTDVPLDKIFEINFSKDVDFDTVDNNIRIVRGSSTSEISLNVSKSNSLKTIKVESVNNFIQDSTYYLIVDNDIKNEDGDKLLNGGVLEFETQDLSNSGFNVTNINYISKHEIEIVFSEDLDQNSALNIQNYTIDGINAQKLGATVGIKDKNKVVITLITDLETIKFKTTEIVISNNVKSFAGSSMEYDYTEVLNLNNKNDYTGSYLFLGPANYNRTEIDGSVNIFGDNIRVKNANITGDLYLHGSFNEFENVDVDGTIFVDIGVNDFLDLKNVKADDIKVLSANSTSGLRLYGVQADTLDVSSAYAVGISLYSHSYPTEIYRTNIDLKSNVKLTNTTFDKNISFGRVEVTKDSIEDRILYLNGDVIKDKEYLEVYKGCKIEAQNSSTTVQNIVLRPEDRGTVTLVGSSPSISNFGEVFVEEQGSLNIVNTTVAKVIMKVNHNYLDIVSGEIGMLVTNNNDVLIDDYTKQNISNIVVKDPDDPEDVTAPEVKAEAQTVYNTLNNDDFPVIAKVQSNELSGYVYIVKTGELQDTYKEIEELRTNNKAARESVSSMNEDMLISTLDLEPGTYYAYAIDGAKNISTRGENAIEVIGLEKTSIVTLDDTPRAGDVTISGKAEANSIVSMKVGTNTPIETTAGADGLFAFTNISITEGQVITFTAKHPEKLTSDDISVTVLQSLKLGNNINSFIFKSASNGSISNEFGDVVGIIDESVTPPEITMNIPSGTITSNFVADFTIDEGATAMINGVAMSSGVSPYISYQGLSVDVEAENGNTKQYKIILNELNGETRVTSTADYVINEILKTIAGGVNDRLDTNLTAAEFNANMVYPANASYVIVASIADEANFSKVDFDLIYNDQTKQINGSENLVIGAKLIVKAEDNTIRIYSLEVTGPKLLMKATDQEVTQLGRKQNDGVRQQSTYRLKTDPTAIKSGAIRIAGTNIEIYQLENILANIANVLDGVASGDISKFDVSSNLDSELVFDYPTSQDPIDNIDQIFDYTDLEFGTGGLVYVNPNDSDTEPQVDAKQKFEVHVTGSLDTDDIYQATIKDTTNNKEIAKFDISPAATNMSNTQIANAIEMRTSDWLEDIENNVIKFERDVYDATNIATVVETVYSDDGVVLEIKNATAPQVGQAQVATVQMGQALVEGYYDIEIQSVNNNSFSTEDYRIYAGTINNNNVETDIDIRQALVDEINANAYSYWSVATSGSDGITFTAKEPSSLEALEIIQRTERVPVGIEFFPQVDVVTGVAKVDNQPIIKVVEFDLTNSDSQNEIAITIEGSSTADTPVSYRTIKTDISINGAVQTTKEAIVDLLVALDWTGEDFKITKDPTNPDALTIEGPLDDIDDITVTITNE